MIEKEIICSVCEKYGGDADKIIKRIEEVDKSYELVFFNYGQSYGGNYCFYGIFRRNNRDTRINFR